MRQTPVATMQPAEETSCPTRPLPLWSSKHCRGPTSVVVGWPTNPPERGLVESEDFTSVEAGACHA